MNKNKNIKYKTNEIERFYSSNRIKWDQFYLSEKTIFERSEIVPSTSVLDIGCGCGGLGLALLERFLVEDYTGIDLSENAIRSAQKMNSKAKFFSGDILDLKATQLNKRVYDLVVSLSCVDWNIEFEHMLNLAWGCVKPGGRLISTFRLTDKSEIESEEIFKKSYQYINFSGIKSGEVAPNVVLNANSLLMRLLRFDPVEITAHGYWGLPSSSAVTPYEKICFSAFSIKKNDMEGTIKIPKIKLDLPLEMKI